MHVSAHCPGAEAKVQKLYQPVLLFLWYLSQLLQSQHGRLLLSEVQGLLLHYVVESYELGNYCQCTPTNTSGALSLRSFFVGAVRPWGVVITTVLP